MKYNRMQEVKRDMFAMRNGIVADALRKGGSPYRFIMGVNLPQLKEIAARYGHDAELAAQLRADRACRESQLLAPLVTDADELTACEAREWINASSSREATDILCHALLRKRSDALDIALGCLSEEVTNEDVRYAGVRLLWNLVGQMPEKVLLAAEAEEKAGCASTTALARSLVEEACFILGADMNG